MDSDDGPKSRTGDQGSRRERALDWFLLEGDRRIIAAAIVVVFTGIVGGLVSAGVLAVGPGSSVNRLFGSGLTAGVVTLVTIVLSISQLVLSRVFGSPSELTDRLKGSRELRGRVEELAGQPSSPNDPAAFLSLVATTLSERAAAALSMAESEFPNEPGVTRTLEDIVEFGRNIDTQVDPDMTVVDVLSVIMGPEYAVNMAAVHHLRNDQAGALTADAQAELEVVDELLELLAVVRQFLKTMALQQDFAALSKSLVYTGLLALLVSVLLTLVYRTSSATLATSTLSIVVPLVFGIVMIPLAIFGAYVLRAATIAHRTVSVGPFVPPESR